MMNIPRIMKLLNTKTRQPVAIGDRVTTSKGETAVLTGIQPPHKPSSEGKVTVKLDGDVHESQYYASVIGCEFWPRDDR